MLGCLKCKCAAFLFADAYNEVYRFVVALDSLLSKSIWTSGIPAPSPSYFYYSW